MAERSTCLRFDRPADFGKSFANAAIAAVTALDTITKFPPYGPGKTFIKCLTVGGDVTVTLEDGSDHVISMGVGDVQEVPITIKAFKSISAGTYQARCYWWYKPQLEEHQYKPNLNP